MVISDAISCVNPCTKSGGIKRLSLMTPYAFVTLSAGQRSRKVSRSSGCPVLQGDASAAPQHDDRMIILQ